MQELMLGWTIPLHINMPSQTLHFIVWADNAKFHYGREDNPLPVAGA
jgi:hypothetical protein